METRTISTPSRENGRAKKKSKSKRDCRAGRKAQKKGRPLGEGVFNLSVSELTLNKLKVLDKGPKFAPTCNLNKFDTCVDIQKYTKKLNIQKYMLNKSAAMSQKVAEPNQ